MPGVMGLLTHNINDSQPQLMRFEEHWRPQIVQQ
jgi:hypothetical protein